MKNIIAKASIIFSLGVLPFASLAAVPPPLMEEVQVQDQMEYLIQLAEEEKERLLRGESSYLYPWEGLEESLRMHGDQEIYLFGYGSLVHPESAAKTLSSEEELIPALAFGVDRIFNYNRDLMSLEQGMPADPLKRANLNVRASHDLSHTINGALQRVKVKDIPALAEREKGYDLLPVIVTKWDCFTGESPPEFFIAYVLSAPNKILDGRNLVDPSIYPYPPYYDLVREGAELFGSDFLEVWLETTYLADGKTTVKEWEQKQYLTMKR